MANMEFRVKPHKKMPSNQMVELWRDGVFVAGVYPHKDGIRIASKYMDGVKRESGYPPSVVVYLSEGK